MTFDVSGVGTRTCTTTAAGVCEVSVVVGDAVPSLTFTVTNLSKAGFTYAPAANHDPDPDSNGTMIVVTSALGPAWAGAVRLRPGTTADRTPAVLPDMRKST